MELVLEEGALNAAVSSNKPYVGSRVNQEERAASSSLGRSLTMKAKTLKPAAF